MLQVISEDRDHKYGCQLPVPQSQETLPEAEQQASTAAR